MAGRKGVAAARTLKVSSENEPCPMVAFVNLIAGKWAVPILYRLILVDAPVRFSDLQRAVSPITQKELTRQLRLFERRNLVRRTVFPEVPPRVEYQITELGKSLRPTLDSLATWMRVHAGKLSSEQVTRDMSGRNPTRKSSVRK